MIDVFSNDAAPQSVAKYAEDWEHVSSMYGLTKFQSWHSQQPHNHGNPN